MAIYTSFIKLWPYDKSFSLRHYTFGLVDGGVIVSFFNSLKMALLTAVVGTMLDFRRRVPGREDARHERDCGRSSGCSRRFRWPCRAWCSGLGYIFFFNHPDNPLNWLYHGMTILVLSTIIHYYTSSHLTAVTALKALDNEFEAVSASLKVPFYKTFFRVTVPVCLPAILDIAPLSVRQRDGDDFGGRVSVLAATRSSRRWRSCQPRRGRRDRPAAAMATLIVAASTTGMHSLRSDHAPAAGTHAGMAASR